MASLKLRLLTVLSLLTLFLSIIPVVFAQSPESFGLTPQKTLPGSSGYVFKRLKEKITEFFKFSKQAKFYYRLQLTEKRLSELASLVEAKSINEIANSSQRFAYQAGILAENAFNEENKTIVISNFEKYKPVLEKLRDNFPANSPFWLLTQQDIDTLNILSSKIK